MAPNDLEQRVNELAGTTAALLAVVASSTALTESQIEDARGLIGSLSPGPVANSPPGSAPVHSAKQALDRIETILKSFQALREAGGS